MRHIALATLALTAAFGAAGCGRRSRDEATATPQVAVNAANVVRVETRRLVAGVTFTGELVPAEIVEIAASFDGDLESVLVREGQTVRRGQRLARYKPREMKDAWQAAEANLQAAQADLAAADSAVRRAKRLVDAGAAASTELETAETQRKAAEARVRVAQAALGRAEENAAKLDVPSPIDGSVSKAYLHSGDRTAVGDRLMQLVDTSTLELSATVPSEALANVQPGTPIEFQIDAFPGETFTGQVDRLNPTTEAGTRQVRVYMRLPNADHRLVGGLFAVGRAIRSVTEKAIAAPVTALRQEGTEQVVYRVRGGIAERVPVHIGLIDEVADVVELQGGVAPGDSLLTGILPGLRAGVRVRVLAAEPSRTAPAANAAASPPNPTAGR